MMEFLYIHWNPDPALFHLGGFTLRWYSVLWMIAILTGSQVVYHLYKQKGLPLDTFQTLFTYSFIGIFAGARLGHCLFYDPQYFLSHPLEIILPVHFLPQGGWVFTGYAGLASHGGTLGLILALVLFCRKTKIHFLDILDMMGVAAPVAAGFIRLANLMNSEIIGMPSDVPWAFIFERVDGHAAPSSGTALRSTGLLPVLPDNDGHLPEEERKRTERLLFRFVYHPDFHLPLFRGVPERKTGGL